MIENDLDLSSLRPTLNKIVHQSIRRNYFVLFTNHIFKLFALTYAVSINKPSLFILNLVLYMQDVRS